MENQKIIEAFTLIAIVCLFLAIICFVGIGLTIHERDLEFENAKFENKKRIEELELTKKTRN